MTHSETSKLLSVLRVAYPNFYRGNTEADAKAAVALWQSMFDAEQYDIVCAAVKAFIATDSKGFPPSIGAIKEMVHRITSPPEMTEAEAWGLVKDAMRDSLYNAQARFDGLPEQIQRLVGSPNQLREWAMDETDRVDTVIASNFQRSYRVRVKSDREAQMLPASVRQFSAALLAGMRFSEVPELEDAE